MEFDSPAICHWTLLLSVRRTFQEGHNRFRISGASLSLASLSGLLPMQVAAAGSPCIDAANPTQFAEAG